MSELSLEDQLEELLSEDVSSLINRARAKFAQLIAPFGGSFILFGAGRLCKKLVDGEGAHRLAREFIKWNFGTTV